MNVTSGGQAGAVHPEGELSAQARQAACPKRMTFGPCGGVDELGGCEVAGVGRCVFLGVPAQRWQGRRPVGKGMPAGRPFVLTDVPAPALDADGMRRCAEVIAGSADAGLTGDMPQARVQFPPSFRAGLLAAAGVAPWPGVNCRDRNRVALEGELAALAAIGVAGVHCVTGDHTSRGHRPDAAAVFDLDSTRLAAVAAEAGLRVSVAEAPAAPPGLARVARLAEKIRAGASVVVLDHCGGPDGVAKFLAAAIDSGLDLGRGLGSGLGPGAQTSVTVLACVPVVTDVESAAVLASFPGAVMPPGYVESVLEAADPRKAGIAVAVELAMRLLEVPGVDGVNVSGGSRPGGELEFARDVAAVGMAVRGGN